MTLNYPVFPNSSSCNTFHSMTNSYNCINKIREYDDKIPSLTVNKSNKARIPVDFASTGHPFR